MLKAALWELTTVHYLLPLQVEREISITMKIVSEYADFDVRWLWVPISFGSQRHRRPTLHQSQGHVVIFEASYHTLTSLPAS